jgi:E1A/CREB-binding protein
VTDIPYFEGDFWPNIIEETIKELDQEAKEREAEASSEVSNHWCALFRVVCSN